MGQGTEEQQDLEAVVLENKFDAVMEMGVLVRRIVVGDEQEPGQAGGKKSCADDGQPAHHLP